MSTHPSARRPLIVVLNRVDTASSAAVAQWKKYLVTEGGLRADNRGGNVPVFFVDSKRGRGVHEVRPTLLHCCDALLCTASAAAVHCFCLACAAGLLCVFCRSVVVAAAGTVVPSRFVCCRCSLLAGAPCLPPPLAVGAEVWCL